MSRTHPQLDRSIPEELAPLIQAFGEADRNYRIDDRGRVDDSRAAKDLENLLPDKDIPIESVRFNNAVELARIVFQSRLQQFMDNAIWKRKGSRGVTDPKFREAPRTAAKTAQEIFTHPADRMTLGRNEVGNCQALTQALAGIIIDPRTLTDTHLSNLGLEEFIPERDGRRQADKMARRAEAIPQIRSMLGNLEPIRRRDERGKDPGDLNYFRLMRVARGPHEGMILGTRNIDAPETPVPFKLDSRHKVLFKSDPYTLHRTLLHIHGGYQEEIRKLKWLESVVDDVIGNLGDWKELSEEEIAELQRSLVECVDSLQFVKKPVKRLLRQQLERCTEFKDRSGRKNPRATQEILSAALRNFLGRRFLEIEKIAGFLAEDATKVDEIIAEEDGAMERFLQTVERHAEHLRILDTNRPMSPEGRQNTLKNLRSVWREMDRIQFEPNLSFKRKFLEQLGKIGTQLAEEPAGGNPILAHEFIKLYLIAKMKRAHSKMQEIYRRISVNPADTDPYALLQELEKFHENLKPHKVGPRMEVNDFYAEFTEIHQMIRDLKGKLRELLHQPESEESRKDRERKPASEPTPSPAQIPLPHPQPPKENGRKRLKLYHIMEHFTNRAGRLGDLMNRAYRKVFNIPEQPAPEAAIEPIETPSSPATPMEAPESHEIYFPTLEEKMTAYAEMKDRIKKTPLTDLVRNLDLNRPNV